MHKESDTLAQHQKDLQHLMECARWLANEFEKLHFVSLTRLFQQTIEDAEVWIHHMTDIGVLSDDMRTNIEQKEVQNIHEILVKYASIHNHSTRQNIIQKMLHAVESGANDNQAN